MATYMYIVGGLKEVHVLANKAVLKGSEVRLSCTYEGYPVPDVMWLLNSQKLSSPNYNVTNNIVSQCLSLSHYNLFCVYFR